MDSISYLIDGKVYATHTQYIPNKALSFHNWADNRNYSGTGPHNYPLETDKSNYISSFVVSEMFPGEDYKAREPFPPTTKCGSTEILKEDALQEKIAKILKDDQ